MNVPNELSPRDFLRNSEFCPERANERFPYAQDIMLGGPFISHSDEDSVAIPGADHLACHLRETSGRRVLHA
jgi:hypothetical protein